MGGRRYPPLSPSMCAPFHISAPSLNNTTSASPHPEPCRSSTTSPMQYPGRSVPSTMVWNHPSGNAMSQSSAWSMHSLNLFRPPGYPRPSRGAWNQSGVSYSGSSGSKGMSGVTSGSASAPSARMFSRKRSEGRSGAFSQGLSAASSGVTGMMNPEAVAERRKRSLTSRRAARESSSSPRRARGWRLGAGRDASRSRERSRDRREPRRDA